MDVNAVNAVLNSHWDGRLPVRPDMIAHQMGIQVMPLVPDGNNANQSGSAEIVNGRYVISYNPQDSHNRIRFTLAHELGHHVLGHTQHGRMFREYTNPDWNSGNYIEERDANSFAAELLMPREAISMIINRDKIYSIPVLASQFGVSEEAMYWRVKNLGYMS
ncbi:ImmA/IrrE family metallo-endopeptidase [Klebsiella grimontii]|uniref:ImmA/IrrE family metallo-endopeptidase n=1 Tax=Klebsiella TaxID=570 RepID=UPI001474078D|nr:MULTISPECIES: ImmA/IrrE family metallo-endopeptidase [Klebsiella]MCE5370109.1 ImmA/IrrE family metallo-endopeptidase [Klebsiella oxytoca]MDU7173345.1 ImmA/IrrE family metallo-endopeptidase [Klebsiella oxytoca]NMD82280.1 ImmA/IrrE family metallo-endopeptidase [Klebsiella sp. DNRA6]HCB1752727.1 ImmA/IrrE family metallo-endopeptidase [Klebsiella oxytoca]HCB1759708.1 ImmA/IrrE family metallo-endopeptidase [Klebsiella oxytoca]